MRTWYAVGWDEQKTAANESWSHGSDREFDNFDLTRDRDSYGPIGGKKHWNSHLGAHFTSEHSTAVEMATGSGNVYHAKLAMKNPKHYESEYDLDGAGYRWGRANGHFGHGRDIWGDDNVADWYAESALRNHANIKKIAQGFRDDLKAQGHDGITYGNQYEGTRGHLCAIAFHPDDITVTSRHRGNQPCATPEGGTGEDPVGRRGYDTRGDQRMARQGYVKNTLTRYPDPEEHDFYDTSATQAGTTREGGKGRPRMDKPGGGDGGTPPSQGWQRPDPVGGPQGGTGGDGAPGPVGRSTPRPHTMHRLVGKEMKQIPNPHRKHCAEGIEGLLHDDPVYANKTHALGTHLKGWNSTHVGRGYVIVHQPIKGTEGIHIGYVGLHDYSEAIRRLTSLDADTYPRLPYSTAFTAPGYDHDYSGPGPKTAAMHDITKPNWYPNTWGLSDEEAEAAHKKIADETDDFLSKVKREWGAPDDTSRWEVENHWKSGMTHALTMGHLTIAEAEKRGYSGGGQEHGEKKYPYDDYYDHDAERVGGWRPLPQEVHHVSTDADAAARQGLKTRSELGQRRGVGLGGGSDDTVSVTDDADLAQDVYHSLHEHHAAATGKITPEQLMHYSEHPPKGVKRFRDKVIFSDHQEESYDALRRGVKRTHHTWDADAPAMQTRSEAKETHPDWSPVEETETKAMITGHEPMYTHWERPLTPDEHTHARSEFYKTFSHARHYAGGHRDPMFVANDPVAFSKADPAKFGIMHMTPHRGAQGYPLHPEGHHGGADSGEWRLGSGSPFDIHTVERPTPRHLSEFGGDQHTAMGANGPDYDNLTFSHHKTQQLNDSAIHQLDSTSWIREAGEHFESERAVAGSADRVMFAHHPDHGVVGYIRYARAHVPTYMGRDHIAVDMMDVSHDHWRRGIASAMQDNLADKYPGQPIRHGSRTDPGAAWAAGYFNDGEPGNGRRNGSLMINQM